MIVDCKYEGNKISFKAMPTAINEDYIYEWISQDGVHYWAYNRSYGVALTPRYNNEGQLVIDKEK